MGATARLCGFLLIAALAGCAQNPGLPKLALFGSDDSGETGGTIQHDEADPAGGPPMPVRNERRRLAGKSTTADGEAQPSGLSLPKLANVKVFSAVPQAPDTTQWSDKPVAVYTQLAQQIRACWLTPGAPKLVDHGFHAEVGATDADEARIILYKKDPNGKRGLQSFRILINETVTGSVVKAENRRLDKKLDQAFKTDISRWAQGQRACTI
jgi:hypothetical protein